MFSPHKSSLWRAPLTRVALFALGGLFVGATSQAAVLAYDTFDSYTSGSTLGGLNGGYGWDGAWASSVSTDVTSSESISYNYNGIVRGGGNSLVVSSQANEAIARSLAGNSSTYTGADYYVSFIFQVNYGTGTGQISNSSYAEDSSFFSVGAGETATQAPSLALGGVIGPKPVARINGAGASGSEVADYNTTYFMVIENVWSETYSAYTQTNVYLYDQTGEVAGLVVSTTNTDSTQNSMEKLAMRVFYIGGGTNGGVPYTNDVTLTFDDFLFADSFESATGAIPEPATYAALAGLAILGIAVLRRRYRS